MRIRSSELSSARRAAELPDPYLTVTLGLPEPPSSPRVAQAVQIRSGRRTVHVVVGGEEELDEGLFSLLDAAYDFATT